MKILKKIGIGCLALIICFCSFFRFVNAEALPEPVLLEQNQTYVFVLEESHVNYDGELVVSQATTYDTIIYSLSHLIFVSNTPNTPLVLIELTYLYSQNGYVYYSFVYLGETGEYNYRDDSVAYFENYEGRFSVYDTIYNLIETYIFGGSIENGSYQDLTAITLSSIVCILVFALPFLIIWKVLKVIVG